MGGSSTNSAVNINGQTNVLVNYNNIFNNYSYDIINNVASSVRSQPMPNTTTGIHHRRISNGPNPKNISKFYDQYDDSNLGLINYGQFLSFVSDTLLMPLIATVVFNAMSISLVNTFCSTGTRLRSLTVLACFRLWQPKGSYQGLCFSCNRHERCVSEPNGSIKIYPTGTLT